MRSDDPLWQVWNGYYSQTQEWKMDYYLIDTPITISLSVEECAELSKLFFGMVDRAEEVPQAESNAKPAPKGILAMHDGDKRYRGLGWNDGF